MTTYDDPFATFRLLDELPAEQQVQLLRALIDVIPDAVMAHGPDGDLVFWSNGVCELLGYSRDEIAGLRSFGWVDPEAIRGAPGRLETILHDGNLTFESRAVRKDGSRFPTLVTARRIDTRRGPLIVSVLRDISSLKSAQEELTFLANHDPLTGVANRSAFEKRLETSILDARRHGDIVAVAVVDLDDLKSVNNRYGYQTGDAALVSIAQRLRTTVREQDVVARLSGDRFAILLTRLVGANDVESLAERLLACVESPIEACETEVRVTASCGIAVCDPTDDDVRTVLAKAEVALHAARVDAAVKWLLWSDELEATSLPPGT